MGNALLALLTHPDDLARVYADRDLIPEVIEETLRWETSVTMVSRIATADTEVAGCPIEKGSPIGVLTGSSNRDEDRWDDADRVEARPAGPAPPRVRYRPAPVPRHAPRPPGAARRPQRDPRPAPEPAPRSRRAPTDAIIEGYAFRGPRALPVLFEPS